MGRYSQAGRPLTLTTPLGDDALLLTGFCGRESISQPYRFRLTLAAPDASRISFDKLLGREMTVHLALPGSRARHFSGLCASIAQGMHSAEHTRYEAEIVPEFWTLTRRVQSRIFQHMTVPDVLARVLADFHNVSFDLEGAFHERDYCVQYQESDFAFACRLMEEEGISYYFVHHADHHAMVVTNRAKYPKLDPEELILHPAASDIVDEQRLTHWEKRQELRSGRVTLRDHTFELPHDPLETAAKIQESVQVGRVVHRLAVGGNDRFELYRWPGEYARRFDGVDRNGNKLGNGELKKINQDARRAADVGIQREAVESIAISGQGYYRHLCSGHRFTLREETLSASAGPSPHEGDYLLTSVHHEAEVALDYASGEGVDRLYRNRFTCIPADLHYRPPLSTPRPTIPGPQTAVVVKGPGDDEIYTDPYGRVKVKFHWDRHKATNADSSCWIRVSQSSAGGGFGMIFIPRGGQEVVVQFQDGDPDQPLITGSVYNPDQMPPFELPAGKMKSGFRSNSYPGGGGLNEITVDDSGKNERMYIHSQFNQDTVVGNNRTAKVGINSTEDVGQNSVETVGVDKITTIGKNRTIKVGVDSDDSVGNNVIESVGNNKTISIANNESTSIGSNQSVLIGANKSELIGSNSTITVGAIETVTVGTDQSITVGVNQVNTVGISKTDTVGTIRTTNVGLIDNLSVGLVHTVEAGLAITISAGVTLTLQAPGGMIQITPSGIEISGKKIVIKGDTVHINP